MRESSLLRAVGRWLDAQPDVWWVKLRALPGSRRGLPDVVGCIGQKFFAVELKSNSGKISVAQSREHEKIRIRCGLAPLVARRVEQVERRISYLRDR